MFEQHSLKVADGRDVFDKLQILWDMFDILKFGGINLILLVFCRGIYENF